MYASPYSARKAHQDRLQNSNYRTASVIPNSRSGMRRSANAKSDLIFGSNGELNASSKKDAIRVLAALSKVLSNDNERIQLDTFHSSEEYRESVAKSNAFFRKAMNDPTDSTWKIFAEQIGREIHETMDRQGFSRTCFQYGTADQGETVKVRVIKKSIGGHMLTTAGTVVPSEPRQHYIYPEDFLIIAHVLIGDNVIAQADADLLDEAYNQCLEQTLVVEDRLALALFNSSVGIANDLVVFGAFTPGVMSNLRTQVSNWGISQPSTMLIANNIWNDILSNAEFSAWFDPVTKRELILDGRLGQLENMQIITDGFRYSTLRVLADGSVYVLGPPHTLGNIIERSPGVKSEAINQYNQGTAKRGWFFEDIVLMTLGNARACAMGQRV